MSQLRAARTIDGIAISKSKEAQQLRQLKEDCHSCLTCRHTKTALGKMLLCTFKNRLVQQYNICNYHNIEVI